ncbi:MAG: hypothetical protein ACRDTD_15960 [Pseudonocardiaceae bacterium]
MGRQIDLNGLPPVFRGSDAVGAGVLSRGQLRGPAVRRLFQGVYSPVSVAETHELYCTGAGLALPPSAVVTGRSAATLRGVALARTQDPVEVLVPLEARVVRGSGLAVRRTVVQPDEWVPWSGTRLATRVRVWLVLDGLHPQPQYWIEDSRGRLARVDLAFVAQRVAVEYDGGWRDGELWALNRDRERLNRVQAAGWEIVFVTAALLRDPPFDDARVATHSSV